jgi:hypothetical protein
MPTARTRGLSTTDLVSLRTAVEAGRKPKVVFTSAAGQIAGQTGQIVRFDDPAADEWVVVRFGRDELPFAPGDLQLPPPKPPRPKASALSAPSPTTNGSTPVTTAAQASTPPAPVAAASMANTAARPVTAAANSATPTSTAAAAAKPAAASTPAPNAGEANGTAPTASPAAGAAAAKSRPARKPGGKNRSPELTVTLGHHEGQWTVQASRGARVVVKPSPVRAADALKMVNLLDSPGVAEAVDEIVAAARAEAEDQAARLRRELAEVEAALADLSDDE